MILAADVGGTYTRLGLFEMKGSLRIEAKILNAGHSSFEDIVVSFLAKHSSVKVQTACFAVAGTVQEGRSAMTNLPWVLEEKLLSQHLSFPCSLINDLEAHAWGVPSLEPKDVRVLQAGKERPGNKALVFAGTGLGEAGIFWDGQRHHPIAGEGGHADFAPRDERECGLLVHLQKKYGHVSYERVLSGPGLMEIERFLGKNSTDEAIDLFFSLLGAEAGNVALKFLSVGGLYIGGGLVQALAEKLEGSRFLSSFSDKGRFKGLLESIPVYLVLTDRTALLGAAKFAIK